MKRIKVLPEYVDNKIETLLVNIFANPDFYISDTTVVSNLIVNHLIIYSNLPNTRDCTW